MPPEPNAATQVEPAPGSDAVAPDAAAQPAASPEAAAAPAGAADETISIPLRNLTNLGVGRDVNAVIQMAKQYQELERGGYAALAQHAGELGWDGYGLTSALLTPPEERTEDQQAQAAQAGQQVQEAAAAQGEYVTTAEATRLAEEAAARAVAGLRGDQDHQSAVDAELAAYDDELTALGYVPKPAATELLGETVEIDPYYELIYRPTLQHATQWLIGRGLNPRDPEYHQKLHAPASRQQVAEAARLIKPFLATLQQQALEKAADEQAQHPAASLADGPGGRAQKSIEDMTPEERRRTAFARARAKGRLSKAE